jgi:hypothetical protein
MTSPRIPTMMMSKPMRRRKMDMITPPHLSNAYPMDTAARRATGRAARRCRVV